MSSKDVPRDTPGGSADAAAALHREREVLVLNLAVREDRALRARSWMVSALRTGTAIALVCRGEDGNGSVT